MVEDMDFQPVKPTLEYLCRATVELSPPLDVGKAPSGQRRIIPITGGRFEGERLRGEILEGGADYQLIQPDRTAFLDARYTLRTPEGELVYVQNRGIRSGSPQVLAQLAEGKTVDPANYYFRTTPTFETGAARYAWLNNLILICSGLRLANTVILDFYIVG